jgi:2-amino-4-hydroxy-6-hydroxymethyldihydropteridine diphosphokinase
MAIHSAFIAIGSNLSTPASQVIRAFQAIEKLPKTKLVKQSSLYKTAPVGYDNQPDFINAVAEVDTALAPQELMSELLLIEQTFGRERPFPNAPRILDLDLLLYDDLVLHTEMLTLPHPRMHTRAFVLLPLAEIAPDLNIPQHGNVVKLAEPYMNKSADENQSIEKIGS